MEKTAVVEFNTAEVQAWVEKYAKALEARPKLAWAGHEKLELFKAWAGVQWGITDEEFEDAAMQGMLKFGMILAEEQPDLDDDKTVALLLRLQVATIIIAVQDLALKNCQGVRD